MNPLQCTACRPIWQEFRKVVDEWGDITPDRRRELIREYLRLVHAADHDETAVLAELRAEEERYQAARETIRRAVSLRVAMMKAAGEF